MECKFCRNQMADNERYCPYCGGDQNTTDMQATVQMQYCPNCGASVLSSDVTCYACGCQLQQTEVQAAYYAPANMATPAQDVGGTQLLTPEMEYYSYQQNPDAQQTVNNQQESGQQETYAASPNGSIPTETKQPKKKKKRFGMAILILVLLVGVCIVGGIFYPLFFGNKNGNFFYLKDNELFMVDGLGKEFTPALLTEDYFEDKNDFWGYMYSYIQESKDGKYVSYPGNIDENTNYDLYVKNLKNAKQESIRVDKDVRTHSWFSNNKIVYQTDNDSLYISDLTDKTKLANDVSSYWASDDSSYVMWTEIDDEGTYDLFYGNEDLKKEKIDSYVTDIYCSKDLKEVVYVKDESLYLVKSWGEKEKLASDVEEIVTTDFEDSKSLVYYTTKNDELSIDALVENDMDTDGEWFLEEVEKEIDDEWGMVDIYVYDIKKNTDTMLDTGVLSSELSTSVVVYAKLAIDEIDKVKLSDMYWNDMSEEIGNSLLDACTLYCAYDGKTALWDEEAVFEMEDVYVDFTVSLDGEHKYIYYVVTEYDDEDVGDLKRVCLTGSEMGIVEEVDSEVDSISTVVSDKVYYLKEYDDNSGELYCNGNFITDDVYNCTYVKEQLVVQTDYDNDDWCYSVSILDGDKLNKICDDVYRCRFLSSKRIAVLFDYNTDKNRGDLSLYDGKKMISIDTDVAALY